MLTVKFGQGEQVIRWAPVDASGRVRLVSGATYTIVDLREPETGERREVTASTPAVVGGVATSLSAAAGSSTREPRDLDLADAAGVERGRTYLLRSLAEPRSTSVKPVVLTGDSIQIGRDLQQDFETGSTFASVELEATFPAADADDELRLKNGGGPFQLTFTYDLDGVAHVTPIAVWLTRYGVPPFVTVDELFLHNAAAAQRFGADNPPESAIQGGTDELVSRIEAAGKPWDLIRTNINTRMAVRKFALAILHFNGTSDGDIERSDRFKAEAEAHVGQLLEGRPPVRTARVEERSNQAPPGSDDRRDGGIIARS